MEDIFALKAEPLSDGSWINSKVARTIELIQEYDPMLEVRWIPRDKRGEDDDVFQIIDKRINRVAFSVKTEAEMDDRVLAKIFKADAAKQKKGPLSILERIDQENAAVKLLNLKERMEADEDRQEQVMTILKSPLNAYKHNGYRYDLLPQDQPKTTIIHKPGVR